MYKLLFYIMLFISTVCQAHAANDMLKRRAFNAPENISTNVHSLTKYLIQPCDNDYDKLYVIAYWIASHISYDEYQYRNGKVDKRMNNYQGNILKEKAGVCGDFAQLFADMANIANVRHVEVVEGYVLKKQTLLKKTYRKKDMPAVGHAWNQAEINGRRFYIDTTFMSGNRVSPSSNFTTNLKHKLDLKKNGRQNQVYTNVTDDYFDFTPKQEIKKKHMLHLQDKFIK